MQGCRVKRRVRKAGKRVNKKGYYGSSLKKGSKGGR